MKVRDCQRFTNSAFQQDYVTQAEACVSVPAGQIFHSDQYFPLSLRHTIKGLSNLSARIITFISIDSILLHITTWNNHTIEPANGSALIFFFFKSVPTKGTELGSLNWENVLMDIL